jgi:hypothetical protein
MQLRVRAKLFAAVLVAVVALFVTAGTAGRYDLKLWIGSGGGSAAYLPG